MVSRSVPTFPVDDDLAATRWTAAAGAAKDNNWASAGDGGEGGEGGGLGVDPRGPRGGRVRRLRGRNCRLSRPAAGGRVRALRRRRRMSRLSLLRRGGVRRTVGPRRRGGKTHVAAQARA